VKKVCSECGLPMSQNEVRLVGIAGSDPLQIHDSCRNKKAGSTFNAASIQRTIRIAHGDDKYDVVVEVCTPIAFELYKTTMSRAGLPIENEKLAAYMMGFVDAAFSIVCGDLKIMTVEQEASK
jgi:hypothetical protein